jgi:hypothetical protein
MSSFNPATMNPASIVLSNKNDNSINNLLLILVIILLVIIIYNKTQ